MFFFFSLREITVAFSKPFLSAVEKFCIPYDPIQGHIKSLDSLQQLVLNTSMIYS